jgi:uncharacterized membrane-anchored protein YhcB (DUF1043 family)
MIYVLILLSGGFIGFSIGFMLAKRSKAFRELQEQLYAKEREFAKYQDQVAAHFEKTADLFAELQARQDNLVLHLQEGAKRLRGGMIEIDEDYDAIAIEGYRGEAPKDYPVGLTG